MTVTEWESESLNPATEKWMMLADGKVHESVALPEPVTLVGLKPHAVLFVENATTAAKPFCIATVTVVVPALPAFTMMVPGVTLIVKSWIVKVTVAE